MKNSFDISFFFFKNGINAFFNINLCLYSDYNMCNSREMKATPEFLLSLPVLTSPVWIGEQIRIQSECTFTCSRTRKSALRYIPTEGKLATTKKILAHPEMLVFLLKFLIPKSRTWPLHHYFIKNKCSCKKNSVYG